MNSHESTANYEKFTFDQKERIFLKKNVNFSSSLEARSKKHREMDLFCLVSELRASKLILILTKDWFEFSNT